MQWKDKLINVDTFLHDVARVVSLLAAHKYVINLCENRYYFLVGFAAALIKKQITVLPQHQKPDLLVELQKKYADSIVLSDSDILVKEQAPIKIPKLLMDHQHLAEPISMPLIDTAQVACIFFTSGSSASPEAHEKQWGELIAKTKLVAPVLGLAEERLCLVATVPTQHLFGFEHTIMMALQTKTVLQAERPFYPEDLQQILSSTRLPVYLISTPYHFSCFIRSDITMPEVNNILSSTAPLTKALAFEIERYFQGSLREIYGCTELGAVAVRNTAKEEKWHLIKGLTLLQQGKNHLIKNIVSGITETLPDVIEQHSETCFSFISRKEDNINIAGKRSSKAYLSSVLQRIEGISDAVIYVSGTQSEIIRVIALVVTSSVSEQAIKSQLRQTIDNVFIPKQILKVETIPRNSMGKVIQSEIAKLILSHSEQKASFEVSRFHPSLSGHFPNNPLVPGVVTLDYVIDCYQGFFEGFRLTEFIQVKFHEKLRAEQKCLVKFYIHRKGVQFKVLAGEQLIVSGIFNS